MRRLCRRTVVGCVAQDTRHIIREGPESSADCAIGQTLLGKERIMTELHRKPSVLRKGESGFCCGQSRRSFMKITTGMAAVSLMGVSGTWAGTGEPDGEPTWARDEWDPREPFLLWGEPLRVQPILMYTVARRREATSWRSWGGVLSEESATEELERISKELGSLSVDAEFPTPSTHAARHTACPSTATLLCSPPRPPFDERAP